MAVTDQVVRQTDKGETKINRPRTYGDHISLLCLPYNGNADKMSLVGGLRSHLEHYLMDEGLRLEDEIPLRSDGGDTISLVDLLTNESINYLLDHTPIPRLNSPASDEKQ